MGSHFLTEKGARASGPEICPFPGSGSPEMGGKSVRELGVKLSCLKEKEHKHREEWETGDRREPE
jgi:hypothetical protein